jgi:hypothetical protein
VVPRGPGDHRRKIKWEAFKDCESLEEIEIPASVIRIHACAFTGCTRLSRIVLRGEGTVLDKDALKGCPGVPEVSSETP